MRRLRSGGECVVFLLSGWSLGAEGWLGGRHVGRMETERQGSVVVNDIV